MRILFFPAGHFADWSLMFASEFPLLIENAPLQTLYFSHLQFIGIWDSARLETSMNPTSPAKAANAANATNGLGSHFSMNSFAMPLNSLQILLVIVLSLALISRRHSVLVTAWTNQDKSCSLFRIDEHLNVSEPESNIITGPRLEL